MERGEHWAEIYSDYILKVEGSGFANGLDVMLKVKKSMMKHRNFCPKQKEGITIN